MSKKIWTFIIGILLILFGVFLIIKPNQTFASLIYYVGVALLITGSLKIISAIINRKSLSLPQSIIFNGIINLLFGIILMNNTTLTIKLISTFIGIWLILSSAVNLLFIFNIKSNVARTNVFEQIIKLVLGIIVLITPIVTTVFTGLILGILLIIIGISTLISTKEMEKTYKVRVK